MVIRNQLLTEAAGPTSRAMELCDTWLECTQHVKAWVPHFSNTSWHRSYAIYFLCSGFTDEMVHGHIIDPQLPGLGQCAGIRTLRVTDVRISFLMRQRTRFEAGQVYVVFGSLAPVWHPETREWMGQLPRRTPFAGAVKIAGQRPAHREYRVAELYAGAMGGWATAAKELPQWTVEVSVECDKQAASTYCLNHPCLVCHDPGDLAQRPDTKPLLALGEIENLLWTNLLNLVDVNVFTISSPCQSWSNIGSRSGTASPNGRTLMHAVQLCRLLQPSVVLFEQVAGFRQHDEFDQFMQAMQEAGFRVATSGVHDLELISYTTRRRWLAVFVNTLHVHRWDILGKWLHPVVRACPTYQPEEHCIALWTKEQRRVVSIKEDEFQVLNDPDLLPRWQRGAPGAQTGALPFRVQGAGMTLPTIVASYRKSVDIPKDQLLPAGLMSWVIRDAYGDIRWMGKFEAAVALGFPATMALPQDERVAFQAVGNAISPMQALLAMTAAHNACLAQQADPGEDLFQPAVSALRSRTKPMDTYMIRAFGIHHEAVVSRLHSPQYDIQCPHCQQQTSQPLLLPCIECCMVACHRCISEQCLPSHFQVVQAKRLEDEGNVLRSEPVLAGAALYTAEDLDTGFIHEVNCFRTPDLGALVIHEDLHSQTRFFHNQEMIQDYYRPEHGTHVHFKRFLRQDDACPLCLTFGMNTQLRICLSCKRMGCKLCIVDKCDRCTNGKLTCRSCHEKAADSKLRALHEAVTLQVEQDTVPIIPAWDWTLVCDIEAEWQLLTVMCFPTGRATIKRSQYYDGTHITATIRAMGYQVEDAVQIFWGDSTTPNLLKAIDSYIMVIPTSYLVSGLIPVISRSPTGESIRMVRPTQSGEAWQHQVLSPDERDRGFVLAHGEHNLEGETVFTLRAGDTIRKIPPWREQERFLEAPDEGMEVLDEVMEVSPVAQIPTSGLGGTMPGTITNWCGVVMLDGRFQPLPLPWPGQTWADWVAHLPLPAVDRLWATWNGRVIDAHSPVEGRPILLRLHARLPGGAKGSNARGDATSRKLTSHLEAKGVPTSAAPDRAEAIIAAVGLPAVQSAYESTDPWRALKTAVGTKIRMVKTEEVKAFKQKPAASSDSRGPDPWQLADPWQQEPKPPKDGPKVCITLAHGHFVDQGGDPLAVLHQLVAEGKGVALSSTEEAQTFATANYLLSEEELGAVVVAPQQPKTGSLECREISFPAMHGEDKVLLKGFLIDFGQKRVRTKEAVHRVDLEPQNTTTMAIEVRREYQQNWDNVAKNPMRFVWSCIDGLQRNVVSTWSRKFFSGRRESKPDVASTWHMFLKVPGDAIEPFLRLSGKHGIFITPKASETNNVAGHYRVIWLDHADLEKALTLQRAHPEIIGLVRGRDTLGVRVKVGDYSTTRVKLEPTWSSQGLLTDIVVEQKWVVAPLPAHSDRGSLQQALIKLPWRAVPLKQLSATTWLVGSSLAAPPPTDVIEIGGQPVLITKQTAKATRNTDQVVLAAPPAFRRSFNTEINKGRWQTPATVVSQSDAAMEQASGPPATARTLLADLRDEVNTRLGDFQAQIQTAVNQVNVRVQEAQDIAATAAMEAEALATKQDHRIQQVENAVQQLSISIVTKADLTGALSAAMEQQSKELRLLLAKRSPDATPTNDTKAQRTG